MWQISSQVEGLSEVKPEDHWSPQDGPCVMNPDSPRLDPSLQGFWSLVLTEEYIQASSKRHPGLRIQDERTTGGCRGVVCGENRLGLGIQLGELPLPVPVVACFYPTPHQTLPLRA